MTDALEKTVWQVTCCNCDAVLAEGLHNDYYNVYFCDNGKCVFEWDYDAGNDRTGAVAAARAKLC